MVRVSAHGFLDTIYTACSPHCCCCCATNSLFVSAVDVISALRAFETTLRAASRHSGVPVYRPLLTLLQELQQSSKPLSEASKIRAVHGCSVLHLAADEPMT